MNKFFFLSVVLFLVPMCCYGYTVSSETKTVDVGYQRSFSPSGSSHYVKILPAALEGLDVIGAYNQSTTQSVKIRAKKRGTWTFGITQSNGNQRTYTWTVVDVIDIAIPQSVNIYVDEEYDYKPIINDPDATTTLTWHSSDLHVATIENGHLIAKSTGTTIITVTASNGVRATSTVTVKDVPVEKISIINSLELNVGQSQLLMADIYPANAANKEISWESSNTDIITVDNAGVVFAKSPGIAIINAISSNNMSIRGECVVTVTQPALELILNKTEATIIEGESERLLATILPDNATDNTITWSSSDNTVATVNGNGLVCAIAEGVAIITAKCGEIEATCNIIVLSSEEEQRIEFQPLTFNIGETIKINATVLPEGASNKEIIWSSDAPGVAAVDVDGRVWFNSAGEATVSAECQDLTTSMTFRVEAVEAQELNVFPTEAVGAVGNSFYLLALHTPDNTTDKSVTWESTNPEVADVDPDGRVELKSEGQAEITATSGNHSATSAITVDSSTQLVELAGNGVAIRVTDGGIDILNAPLMARVIVSTLEGRVVTAMYAETPELHIPLIQGIYIVKVGDTTTAKIMI